MKSKRSFLVLYMILTVCMLFSGCEKLGSKIGHEQKLETSLMDDKEVKAQERSKPTIDAVKVDRVETATFALG
jgi:hypothetical protein